MASFSVLVLMKESAAVIHRFAAHYSRIGAAQIVIYNDGPIAPDLATDLDTELLARQNVELVPCDDAFWDAAPMERPQDIQDRQRAIYMMGQARCTSGWALICDADEFVIDRMPVPEFLDAIPADVVSVAIAPVEAVWGVGEDINEAFGSTWFRRPDFAATKLEKRLQLRSLRLYGPLGILFRSGILSHAVGKQFIRTDAQLGVIDLHFSTIDGKSVTRRARDIDPALAQVELAHFDAISFERWHAKSLRRVTGDTRAAMMRRSGRRRLQLKLFDLLRRFDPAGTRWFYRRLYTLTLRQQRLLEKRGMAFSMRLFD